MADEISGANDDMLLRSKLSKAYKRIADKKLDSDTPSFLCNYWNEEPAVRLDGRGNTLLHLVVIRQYEEAVEKLMDVGNVTLEQLKKQNLRGETALHEAARHDSERIVELLLKKEMELIPMLRCSVHMCNCKDCAARRLEKINHLVSTRNVSGETALFLAAACGKWKIFLKMIEYDNEGYTTRSKDGCTVLHAAIRGEYYLTATKILHMYPQLAQVSNDTGDTALNLLASSPSSFRSNSFYTTATMANASFIPLHILRVLLFTCIPHMYDIRTVREDDEEDPDRRMKTYIEGIKRNPFVDLFLGLPWIQQIDDTKRKNMAAVALAKQLLEEEEDWSRYTYSAHKDHDQCGTSDKEHPNPLIQAIEMGIPELVEEILRYFPDAANSIGKDGKNVFHFAAENRGGEIYEKLKESAINKDRMLLDVDNKGNTILHHAAKTKPATNLSQGVSKLMAWDICWFQRIRDDCPAHLLYIRNNNKSTAEDLLMEDYDNKQIAAEKAVKELNQGLMVVAALIATVSFAAVFTLPGGFDQTKGSPLLFNEKRHKHDLDLFLIYVGFTFFASLIALGTLLSTQLSQFHLGDLYFALPMKYSIAMSCLLLSSCSIFATFLQALILEDFMPPYYYTSFIIGCIVMGLVYVDPMYHVLRYILEVLRHSKATYKRSQEHS
ncbi:HIT domain-containing protein [Heracleum sosnowskyi]|uniref:HIT domain-containing protein n=1 Tax=Heracleum sosnowskyi TaxID=360622 RepID=A0AAD8IGH8_9APIA|nr:HIT domain-containing protein [Heracleum sosnowskyi]